MLDAKVLVISNHHRTSLFFETTIKRLLNAGVAGVLLLETGGGAPLSGLTSSMESLVLGGHISYMGVGRINNQITYDQGMQRLHKATTQWTNYDVVLLIDNDCFLSDVKHLERYVAEFIHGGYDFASHLVRPEDYEGLEFGDNCIAEVPHDRQKFLPSDIHPGFVPSPHWENSYTLISESMWKAVSTESLSHSRRWIREMHEKGAKFGAHKANYRWVYSHFGDEWFHVGQLMSCYYDLVKVNLNYDPNSEMSAARFGYFAAQERSYGEIYHETDKAKLRRFYNHFGGKDAVLAAWDKLTENTCMQNWEIL